MDKYYIPKLEEFHIGFEYEWLNKNNEWVKETSPIEITIKDFSKQTYGLRVKYLDKEDIESLGWELDQKTKDGCSFIFGNMIDGDYMLWTKDFNRLELFNTMGNKTNDVSFEGFIKNKSELKKLMKQLNIN